MIAAIDIGTNTVRLLIAKKDAHWHDVVRIMEITRLGEGVNRTLTIKPEAMERTLTVLVRYKELIDRYGAEKVRVVSTSAMRDATNASEFVSLVKERTDLSIEVIPGEEEGRLTFAGATGQDSIVPGGALALVVDVGGGSTEYIYGKDGMVFGATSLDIGSVRLTEQYLRHDPPKSEELEEARAAIQRIAGPLFAKIAAERPSVMVAVAGTATQLSALHYGVEPYDPKKIHGSVLTRTDLESLIDRLKGMPLKERKKMKGMHPQRADVIVAGALILDETLRHLNFTQMTISERDILDGIIYSIGE